MKELSIEQKAKAYDEAIDKVAHFIKKHVGLGCIIHPNSSEAKELFNIFPELQESDDDKIKKALINFLKSPFVNENITDEKVTPWIDWLEKQGKSDCPQNHQDSGRPNGGIVLEDFNGGEGFYKLNLDYLNKKQVEEVEEMVRAWNKKSKFKTGDWIIFNGLILHIDEVVDGYYRTTTRSGIHNSYDWDIDNIARLWTIQEAVPGDVLVADEMIVLFKKKLENDSILTYFHYDTIDEEYEPGAHLYYAHIYPATKEQYDLLFSKMKEAGYVWDDEKKELREIKHKVEPIFKAGDKIQYLKGCGKIMIIEKIKNGKYIFANGMGYVTIKSGNKWYLVNPAWTEEDNSNLQCCIAKVQHDMNNGWIGRNRELLTWLESLKDRYSWKPSEEQLRELNCVISGCSFETPVLDSLYNDLKKLK